MDRVKEAYKLFKEVTKKGLELYVNDSKTTPRINEIRELVANFPIYVALVNCQNAIFKCIILTEDVPIGWLGKETPVIKLSHLKTLLVALPFWVYLDENFLLNHTKKISMLNENDIHHLEDYAKRTKIPQDIRGEYIRSLMKLLAPYNTGSILTHLEKLEEYSVFTISDELKTYFENSYYTYTNSSKNVHKGKNFFAIVEKIPEIGPKLTLYLPQDYLGQKITIKVENNTLFEDTLETIKLEFVNLPDLPDYTSWLEAIEVSTKKDY